MKHTVKWNEIIETLRSLLPKKDSDRIRIELVELIIITLGSAGNGFDQRIFFNQLIKDSPTSWFDISVTNIKSREMIKQSEVYVPLVCIDLKYSEEKFEHGNSCMDIVFNGTRPRTTSTSRH